jgi:hypothetical protein
MGWSHHRWSPSPRESKGGQAVAATTPWLQGGRSYPCGFAMVPGHQRIFFIFFMHVLSSNYRIGIAIPLHLLSFTIIGIHFPNKIVIPHTKRALKVKRVDGVLLLVVICSITFQADCILHGEHLL